MPTDVTRIAMWSGPRNISTAMMRAFENRPDTVVWDEPFYAAELAATGRDHPMRDEVIAAGPTDPEVVVARLLAPLRDEAKPGATVFYQKHMTHHMLPSFRRDWVDRVTSAFLIREPERVLASYTRTWDEVSIEAIGVSQQLEIFERVAERRGHAPPVIYTADVLADPRGCLSALCAACGIPFSEAMLSWPAGRRASDGVWAPAWYAAVERSTGFGPSDGSPLPRLEPRLARIAEAARPVYERLRRHRLSPAAA
ncbi:MAG: hypothetical protein SFW09_16480 [Hyphomicrobiaceae bacterium]|nr:hypothetical protein [Hyphomicrobiaceae bacterium]